MIPKPPVFLFAFANDTSNTLSLEKEARIIRENLKHLHDVGRIDHQIMGATTLDDLFKSLNRFHNRVHVLHFGGHSDPEYLMLRDKLVRGSNLARVIGMQKNLKLVFLNGCANKAQVDELFAQGVKAVIATAVPIGDDKAVVFADIFYDALKGGKTIKESFDSATGHLLDNHPEMDSGISRDVIFRLDDPGDDFPWALYATEEADLNWTIPDAFQVPDDVDYHAKVELTHPDTNKKLEELTCEGMADVSRRHKGLWEDYQDENVTDTSIYDLRDAIYGAFPSLLSVHIRDVFTDEARRQGRLRLEELSHVYVVLGKLLGAINLANLWQAAIDEKTNKPKPDFKIRQAYKEDLRQYLNLSSKDADSYDVLWLVVTINSILTENGLTSFIPDLDELGNALVNDEELYTAWQFLEYTLKKRIQAQNIPTIEVAELCEKAELHVGVLLKCCAFLTSYQLVSVSDISVIKRLRSSRTDFVHHKVVLRGVEETVMDRDPLARANFTCNHAVVITRNFNSDEAPLILTPFLIDENAYKIKKREQPKIHFWAGNTPENHSYFQHAEVLVQGFEFPNDIRNMYRVKDLKEITSLFNLFEKDLGL